MKKLYLRQCLLLALLCLNMSTYAQNSYRFEATTATYTDLVNPSIIRWMDFNAGDLYNLTEMNGETFWFYDIPFPLGGVKTFAVQSNGNLRIDNDSTLVIADGAFTYLDSIDATSSVSYVIEGGAGTRLVKAQWKNVRIRVGEAVNFVNFQIWVYQQSGVIEIHYGSSSPNNQSGFGTTNGPQVGMFFSEDDFTKCYEKLWVNGSPSNFTLDSNATYVFKAMSGVPVEGVVFRFIPRSGTTGLNDEIRDAEYGTGFYPNPVKGGTLFLKVQSTYEVFDLTGKTMLHAIDANQIDVSTLQPGMYFFRRNDGRNQKFLIE